MYVLLHAVTLQATIKPIDAKTEVNTEAMMGLVAKDQHRLGIALLGNVPLKINTVEERVICGFAVS